MFRTIYQKTQRLVWGEPCQDHGPQRKKKCTAHRAHFHEPRCTIKKDVLRSIHSTVQLKLHEMQDSWLSTWTDEIQGYTDKNDMKLFTAAWRKFSVPPVLAHLCFWMQMESSSCQKNKILERWSEHVDGLLNRPSSINDKNIEQLLHVPVNVSLEVTPTLRKFR